MRHRLTGSGILARVVWVSSRAARAEGAISVLAVTETIAAVTVYWWIAAATGSHIHLLIGVIAAPFLLLRSPESIETGLRLWQVWSAERLAPAWWTAGAALVGTAAGSVAAAWTAAHGDTVPGPRLAGIVIMSGSAAGLGACIAILGESVLDIGPRPWSLRSAVCILGGPLAAAFVTARLDAPGWPPSVWGWIVEAPGPVLLGLGGCLAAGCGLGFLLPALAIRLVAAVAHLRHGLRRLPQNWVRSTLVSDLAEPPELIPEIERLSPHLTFAAVATKEPGFSLPDIAFRVIVGGVWFLPTLAYRLSLKATSWLYLPLIYVARTPARLQDPAALRDWLANHPATVLEWLRFVAAAIALGIAAVTLADHATAGAVLRDVADARVILSPFTYLLVLDWTKVQLWHWISLPSAMLTVILFLWTDFLRRHVRPDGNWQLTAVVWLNNARTLLVICWLAVSLSSFAAYSHANCLAEPLAPALDLLFGPAACPALPSSLPPV